MKHKRILSTAGVCPSNSTKLRSYCNLLQGSLTDKWLFADDFVSSHVCFVRDDYLAKMNISELKKSQVVVVVNVSNNYKHEHRYQIPSPLTASKIKSVLNQISKDEDFKSLREELPKSKSTINRFKTAFRKIRKNIFGKSGRKMADIKKENRELFISRITQKMNIDELPNCKIVLLGSPGSGKTTAIQSASDGKSLDSDVFATDSVAREKEKTTVGIDYAEISLGGITSTTPGKVTLFGTPGQIKFNFIWDMVGKSADGFIILLDMSRPEPLSYLKFYHKFVKNELGNFPEVYCALTHCEKYDGDIPSLTDCIKSEFPSLKGIYKIDARRKFDIISVLKNIYPKIQKRKAQSPASPDLSVVKTLNLNKVI